MADYTLSAKITGDSTGFEKAFSTAEKTVERFESRMKGITGKFDNIGKTLSSVGDKLTSKITKPAMGAASALTGLTLVKGFNRLTGIDDAKAKLKGLGYDAENVTAIMNSALESVKGTAYGMDEAATTAASAVAAGIKPGKELTRYLSLTADAAAIAGASMADMGSIINKVQTAQVAYTDDLNMLADRGLPIYQWLADAAGITAAEVKKMASEGKISSEMFLSAIEKNIGGAAKIMGESSFKATIANIGASLARIGANFLDAGGKGGGFFSTLKPMLADFNERLGVLEEKATELGVKFGEMFNTAINRISEMKGKFDALDPSMQSMIAKGIALGSLFTVGIGPGLSVLGKGIGAVGMMIDGLNGITSIAIETVGGLPATFTGAGRDLKKGAKIFGNLKDAILLPLQDMAPMLGQVLSKVSNSFGNLGPMLASKLPGITNTLSSFMATTAKLLNTGPIGKYANAAKGALAKVLSVFSGWKNSVGAFLGTVVEMWNTGPGGKLVGVIKSWGPKIGQAISGYAGVIGDALAPIFQKVVGFVPTFIGYMNVAAGIGIIIAGLGLLYSQFGTQIDQILIMVQTKGPQVVTDFCNGIASALPGLIAQGSNLVANLMLAVTANLPAVVSGGVSILSSLISGIASQLPTLIPIAVTMIATLVASLLGNIGKLVDSGLKLLTGLTQGLLNAIPKLISAAPTIIGRLVSAIVSNLPKIVQTGIQLIGQLAVGLIRAIPQLVGRIPAIISAIKNAFTSVNWGEVGMNIIRGIASGISGAVGTLVKAAASAAESALNWVKNKLGIHSPSRVFRDEVGKMMALGMGIGFENNVPIKMLNAGIDDALKRLKIESAEIDTQLCATRENGMVHPDMTYFASVHQVVPHDISAEYARRIATESTSRAYAIKDSSSDYPERGEVKQVINIYQPVRSPVETARELKKVGKELAYGR